MASNEPWVKDPSSLLDYAFDWSDWLGPDDTISTMDTIITPNTNVPLLVVEQQSVFEGVHTIWLSGGRKSTKYNVKSKITTVDGREEERTRTLKIMSK